MIVLLNFIVLYFDQLLYINSELMLIVSLLNFMALFLSLFHFCNTSFTNTLDKLGYPTFNLVIHTLVPFIIYFYFLLLLYTNNVVVMVVSVPPEFPCSLLSIVRHISSLVLLANNFLRTHRTNSVTLSSALSCYFIFFLKINQ